MDADGKQLMRFQRETSFSNSSGLWGRGVRRAL